jgi:hypothetical protein
MAIHVVDDTAATLSVIASDDHRLEELALGEHAEEGSMVIDDRSAREPLVDQDPNRIEESTLRFEHERLGDHDIPHSQICEAHALRLLGQSPSLSAERPHAPQPLGLLSPPQVPRMPPRPANTPTLRPPSASANTTKLSR